jgi:hypothetical protein
MIKKLLVLLALVSSFAYAETWFEASNQGGGKIVLLMHKCSNSSDSRVVIAQLPSGSTSTGCWTYIADLVVVLWDTGDIRTSTYNANVFVMRERK